MKEQNTRVNVQFSDDEGRTEMLPAIPVGGGLYRMDHSPSFAYGISKQDIFSVRTTDEGVLAMNEVVEKSGNRTVRLLLTRFSLDSPEIVAIQQKASELGCECENLLPHMITVNVPADSNLISLTEFLIEQHVWWEVADPVSGP